MDITTKFNQTAKSAIKLTLVSIALIATPLLSSAQSNGSSRAISTEPEFKLSINSAESVVEIGKNHYLIDFGKAFFGTVALKSEKSQSTPIAIHVGEKLNEDGILDREPGGTIRYYRVELEKLSSNKLEIISLPKDTRNTKAGAIALPDTFGIIAPFRYCEIENLTIPIDELEITQRAYHYKFDDNASYFTSSDTILNQVWDMCKHTIKATTFAGYYVDGDRERIPYEADAYINQLSHYCLDDVYSIARRTNDYFIDHPTWPTEWLLHTVMLFYQDYIYTGNIDKVAEHYDMLKLKTLMDLEREDGLISSKSEKLDAELKGRLGFKNKKTNVRDIVDWPAGQKDTGWKLATEAGERDGYEMVEINSVVNSFYYYNLVLMAKMAKDLGKDTDSKMFSEKSEIVKETINSKLFDKSRGVYVDGEGSTHASLHANMFPLAFGITPTENQESVVEFIKTRGMACSVYGAQYLLEGLYNAGEADYALDLMTETTSDRNWWNMIRVGSTMALEAWDAKYKPNLDWNHAWGTAPTNIVSRYMWGVTPQTPGYKTVQVKPQLSRLTESTIKVPTINGDIYASYRDKKGKYSLYTIDMPSNMEGEFIIPINTASVKHNGKKLDCSCKTITLKAGKNSIKIKH